MTEESPATTGSDDRFSIGEGTEAVTVSKYPTKRGERAEFSSGDDRLRVDALILESISWQRTPDDLASVLENGRLVVADETPFSGGEPVATSPVFRVTNEYTQVILEHVRTGHGDALRIRTPTRGTETTLGPQSLQALAIQPETVSFSVFFETPVGPEDTRLEGPH